MKKEIYLDYSATTPINKKVLNKMMPYLKENYGNASSIHALGQKSLFAIDTARNEISNFLDCNPEEIFFTGSATEANNLAIFGLIKKIKKENNVIHVITSAIEHDAVLCPLRQLEKEKKILLTIIPVDKEGLIDVDVFKNSIKKETRLISFMYVNNEIGVIQPIRDIQEIIKTENSERNEKNKIFFHTDAVQAINYLDCRVSYLSVDMLSFSSHKIYGPKGVGVLYIKRGTPIDPIIYGGGQEKGLRSGTENVALIVGVGEAVKIIKNNLKDNERIEKLKTLIIEKVLNEIKDSRLNGSLIRRVPNNINFSFKGAEGESVVMALDQKGVRVSTGSACSSSNLQPSHVLLAINLSREEAHCSLRITLGRETKKEDIDKFLKILPGIIERLRKISGRN
jgi:cysteine desulfurase